MKDDESEQSGEQASPTFTAPSAKSPERNEPVPLADPAAGSAAHPISTPSAVAANRASQISQSSVESPSGDRPLQEDAAATQTTINDAKMRELASHAAYQTPSPVQPPSQLASASTSFARPVDAVADEASSHEGTPNRDASLRASAVSSPSIQPLSGGFQSNTLEPGTQALAPLDSSSQRSPAMSTQPGQLPIRIDRIVPVRQSARSSADYSENVCSNCGTTSTPLWRRGNRGEIVCNACGLYLRVRNASRPTHLKRQPKLRNLTTSGSGSGEDAPPGSCPGDGRCNGTGGASACVKCPSYNNRVGRAQLVDNPPKSQTKSPSPSPESSESKPGDPVSNTMLVSCQNCGTVTTPLWRRDREGHIICNACGLYLKMHRQDRPVALGKGMIKRRKRVLTASGEDEASWTHEHVSGGDCCSTPESVKDTDEDRKPQSGRQSQTVSPSLAPHPQAAAFPPAQQAPGPPGSRGGAPQPLPPAQQQLPMPMMAPGPHMMMMPPQQNIMQMSKQDPSAPPPGGQMFPPTYPVYGMYYPTPMVMQEQYNAMAHNLPPQRVPPPIDFTNAFKPDSPPPGEDQETDQSGQGGPQQPSQQGQPPATQQMHPHLHQATSQQLSPAVQPRQPAQAPASQQGSPAGGAPQTHQQSGVSTPVGAPVAVSTPGSRMDSPAGRAAQPAPQPGSSSHVLTGFAGKGGHVGAKRAAEHNLAGSTPSKRALVEEDNSPLLVLKYLSGDSVKEYLLAARRHLQDKVDEYSSRLEQAERHLSDCDKKLAELE